MESTQPLIPAVSPAISDRVISELRKIIQAIDQNSKRLVRRVGLTGPQLVILKAVAQQEEVSVGEIARNVSLSQGTVTGVIERLVGRDLILRWKSGQDRRRVMVKVTPTGQRLLAQAPPLMQEAFMSRFNQLPAWRQTMILSALQQLSSIMATKLADPAPLDPKTTSLNGEPLEKETLPLFL